MAAAKPITCLYIDASNIYGGLVEMLPNGCYIDFKDILACIREDFQVDKIKAYGTFLTDDPSSSLSRRQFIRAQRNFFESIKQTPDTQFFKGHFSPTSKKEKGIDVMMAVDIVKDAFASRPVAALVMSGDADFVYPIQCLRAMGIKVYLVTMGSRFAPGLAYNSNRRHVYDINNYFTLRILPNLRPPVPNVKVKDITGKITIQ